MPQRRHPVDESTIRTRVRALMGNDNLPRFGPRLWAARACKSPHACIVCTATIRVGKKEFEARMPGDVLLFLHRRCFEIWTDVAAGGDGLR